MTLTDPLNYSQINTQEAFTSHSDLICYISRPWLPACVEWGEMALWFIVDSPDICH